jgi:hypothetical protein
MDVNTRIISMYENIGYLGMYSKDVLITILLFLISIGIIAYSSYQSVVSELKNNWNEHKCNPIVMPFAGIIMPTPGQTTMDTTFENFNYCIQQDVSSIMSIVMMPLEFVLYLTINLLRSILDSIMALIEFINWLKSQVTKIYSELLQKVIQFIIPLAEMLVHMQDMLGKINGVLITTLYTTMNIYNLTISGIINIMTILINIIIAFIVIFTAMMIIAIALIPTPAFAAGLAIYSSATVMLLGVIIPPIVLCVLMHNTMTEVFNEGSPSPPDKPSAKKKKKK